MITVFMLKGIISCANNKNRLKTEFSEFLKGF